VPPGIVRLFTARNACRCVRPFKVLIQVATFEVRIAELIEKHPIALEPCRQPVDLARREFGSDASAANMELRSVVVLPP